MDWVFPLRSIERVLVVLAGILCVYLGYSLFVKGVSGKASLRAEFDKSKIQLANAMPGVFFALFGMSILIVTIRQTVTLDAAIPVGPNTVTIEPLKATEKEAGELNKLYGGDKERIIKTFEPCDGGGLKLEKYKIIHLATHGMLREP